MKKIILLVIVIIIVSGCYSNVITSVSIIGDEDFSVYVDYGNGEVEHSDNNFYYFRVDSFFSMRSIGNNLTLSIDHKDYFTGDDLSWSNY